MTIFFCGSSGQGKTTTANLLNEATGLKVIDGISRSSVHKHGTDEHQQWLSKTIYRISMTEKGIHCRTPLDVYAYTQAYGRYSPCDETNVRFFSFKKPVMIYFPLLFKDIEDDGVRPTDLKLNETVDGYIKSALDRYNFNYLALQGNSPEERVQDILNYCRSYYDLEGILARPTYSPDV